MSDHSGRKTDHLELTLQEKVGHRRTHLLEQVEFLHCSLPELSLEELDLRTRLGGLELDFPLLLSSMTGGNPRAGEVNLRLAEFAERAGLAMGLGSQRPMVAAGVVDREVARSYQLRKIAPTVPIFGNLGVVQAGQLRTEFIEEMLKEVGANGLFIHLNPAQEMFQAGGDRDFRGNLQTIERLQAELTCPLIVKETGNGISRPVAVQLRSVGVRHLDVAGAGGTSWIGVETLRGAASARSSGEVFWDWGIPTAASLLQVQDLGFETLIATGGLKNGLDLARALSLGASLGSMAREALIVVEKNGVEEALAWFQALKNELICAMVLTGSRTLSELRDAPKLLGAELERWRPRSL